MLKEREERVKRVRHEQEAERLKKAEEWKQQVSQYLLITRTKKFKYQFKSL